MTQIHADEKPTRWIGIHLRYLRHLRFKSLILFIHLSILFPLLVFSLDPHGFDFPAETP